MSTSSRLLRIIALILVALVTLIVLLVARALLMPSKQLEVQRAAPVAVDAAAAAERLAAAIRIRTVSSDAATPEEAAQGRAALAELGSWLVQSYPEVHSKLSREAVGEGSLLYTWKGSDASLDPALLAAHLDVVPAGAGSEAAWTHPPFAGAVADGYVWGRGAVDDKFCVVAILEAVERLLKEGYEPKRTVYLAFGHDEEVHGTGAAAMAAMLRERHVTLDYVLDEGLPIAVGIIPGIEPPVAVVGIAEKGYTTLALTVTAEGGHSSTPPRETAIGILGKAVSTLEARPFPARFGDVAQYMFEYLAPEMGLAERIVFGNRWLTTPLIEHLLSQSPETDALIRTTTAVTLVEGGVKENVLPRMARATVNFRSLPGDDPNEIAARVREVVGDERVQVEILAGSHGSDDPSPIALAAPGAAATPFERIMRTVREVYEDTLVAPGLVLGATDARQYAALSRNVYRFAPVRMESSDVARVHGIDERISLEDLADGIEFYYRLLQAD